jgi:hypothetical protein
MPGQPKAQAQVLEHRSDSQNLNRATPAVPGKKDGETVPAVPGNEKAKARDEEDE